MLPLVSLDTVECEKFSAIEEKNDFINQGIITGIYIYLVSVICSNIIITLFLMFTFLCEVIQLSFSLASDKETIYTYLQDAYCM